MLQQGLRMDKIIRHQHIPKTGSTSTKKFYKDCIVYGYENDQLTLNADIPEDAISFTILRDPLERFCSNIKYISNRTQNFTQDQIIDIIFNKRYTAEEYTTALESHEIQNFPEIYTVFHGLSIFDPFLNVFDQNQNLKAKHLINFNNMQNELMELLPDYDYTNFPKQNVSTGNIELSADQLEQFNHHYAEDIKYYNQTGFNEKNG